MGNATRKLRKNVSARIGRNVRRLGLVPSGCVHQKSKSNPKRARRAARVNRGRDPGNGEIGMRERQSAEATARNQFRARAPGG